MTITYKFDTYITRTNHNQKSNKKYFYMDYLLDAKKYPNEQYINEAKKVNTKNYVE